MFWGFLVVAGAEFVGLEQSEAAKDGGEYNYNNITLFIQLYAPTTLSGTVIQSCFIRAARLLNFIIYKNKTNMSSKISHEFLFNIKALE